MAPPIPGLAGVPYLTNETVFTLTRLPRRLVVLGAGPIGVELAQAFQRLGSQVTLISESGVLPREDREAAGVLQRRLEAEGIVLHLDAKVTRVDGHVPHPDPLPEGEDPPRAGGQAPRGEGSGHRPVSPGPPAAA